MTPLVLLMAIGAGDAPETPAGAGLDPPPVIGSRTPAQVGSLHRTAATLEATLDVYRLVLLEVVPAVRKVREAGTVLGAEPATPIPEVAIEVFRRLNQHALPRIPASSLPPISRGYHAEAVDGLEGLAAAESISDVLKPARVLLFALGRLCAAADNVIDLFSRDRPLRARLVDHDVLFDDLANALDEFAAAEAEIRRRQRRADDQDAIAAAFRRTEVALGHLLDLWAVARRMGIDLTEAGQPFVDVEFTARISTAPLQLLVQRMRARLKELDEVLSILATKPPPIAAMVTAVISRIGDTGKARARVVWERFSGDAPVAKLRVYRVDDVAGTIDELAAMFRCEGSTPEQAIARAIEATAELDGEPRRRGELNRGRTRFTDRLPTLPVVPPTYIVSSVSVYGVESPGPPVRALYLPRELMGPSRIEAELHAVSPNDPNFYLDGDAVTVRWRVSPSDFSASDDHLTTATEMSIAVARGYVIEQVVGDKVETVAQVPAGITEIVVHPTLQAMRQGVAYRVATRGGDAGFARPPESCGQSATVTADRRGDFRLAAAGASVVQRPTQSERRAVLELYDNALLDKRRRAFAARAPAEQQNIRQRWWRSIPRDQRALWLRGWSAMFADGSREPWLNRWDGELRERDEQLARAVIYVDHNKNLYDEVTRWWELLDDEAKQRASSRWRHSLNARHREWVDRERARGSVAKYAVEAPLRLLTWWTSRDPIEQQQLDGWWWDLDPQAKQRGLQQWYASLPAAGRGSVRWPQWRALTVAERQALLRDGVADMPDALWRNLFAWLAWEMLEGDELVAAVEAEVGPITAALHRARYALRDVDRAVGFRLVFIVVASTLSTLSLWFVLMGLFYKRRAA